MISEDILGILVFTITAMVCAVAWHSLCKKYFLAVAGATLTTTVGFQLINYLFLGYLDPFFLIAMSISAPIAFIISGLTGMPFRAKRSKAIKSKIHETT